MSVAQLRTQNFVIMYGYTRNTYILLIIRWYKYVTVNTKIYQANTTVAVVYHTTRFPHNSTDVIVRENFTTPQTEVRYVFRSFVS